MVTSCVELVSAAIVSAIPSIKGTVFMLDLGANINSSILWNVSEILKEFHYRGRLIRESQKIINDLKAEERK